MHNRPKVLEKRALIDVILTLLLFHRRHELRTRRKTLGPSYADSAWAISCLGALKSAVIAKRAVIAGWDELRDTLKHMLTMART